MLRTIECEKGGIAELCKQCKITFENFIKSGRIID